MKLTISMPSAQQYLTSAKIYRMLTLVKSLWLTRWGLTLTFEHPVCKVQVFPNALWNSLWLCGLLACEGKPVCWAACAIIVDDLLVWGEWRHENGAGFKREFLQRAREKGYKLSPRERGFRCVLSWTFFLQQRQASNLITAKLLLLKICLPLTGLGIVNDLPKFISNLSERTAPLREMLRRYTNWSWEAPYQKAFEPLKLYISNPQSLFLWSCKGCCTWHMPHKEPILKLKPDMHRSRRQGRHYWNWSETSHCNRDQTSSHRTCLPSTNAVAAAEVQFEVHLQERNRTISGRHIVTCLRKKEIWYWKWLFDWHIVFHPNLNQKYVSTPKTHLTWSCHPKDGLLLDPVSLSTGKVIVHSKQNNFEKPQLIP